MLGNFRFLNLDYMMGCVTRYIYPWVFDDYGTTNTVFNEHGRCSDAAPLHIQPVARAKVTLKNRLAIAKDEFEVGPTCHITNGDEENVPRFAGQYHKTLPHDEFGQVRV